MQHTKLCKKLRLPDCIVVFFFDKAAFYGDTCLRIFHNLPRFSEDMDFSFVAKNEAFDLESYFPAVIEEFKATGRDIVITRKVEKR